MSTPEWVKHAYVGQKVVCNSDAPVGMYSGWNYPELGGVYTIRLIRDTGHCQILLQEISNRKCPFWNIEPGFNCKHFRPLQSKSTETGMSILRKLLHTKELVE